MEQNVDTGAPIAPVAENNKQNGGNGLKIATAIACVVAVCGIGFGVYGIMQSMQKDSQISDLKAQTENYNSTTSERTTENNDTRNEAVVTFPNLGFKSDNFIGSTTYTISDSIPGSEQEIKAAFTITSPNVDVVDYGFYTIYADGRIKAHKDSISQLEAKDITSNFSSRVTDLAIGGIGNGGNTWIIALLDDGTVETLSEGTFGKETFSEKASPVYNAKNITKVYGNIIDSVGSLGYVQDRDGKIRTITLNDASADEWTFKVSD